MHTLEMIPKSMKISYSSMDHPFTSFFTVGNFYVALKRLILIHFKDICIVPMSKSTFKKSYDCKFITHLKADFLSAKVGLEHSYL